MNKLTGLDSTKVTEAMKKFGANKLRGELKKSKIRTLLLQFKSPMVYVLLGASLLSVFMDEYLNAIAIFVVVVINSLISFFQEIKAESSMNALQDLAAPKARVKRDGKITIVESEAIVPGDILILEAGDYVVADAQVLTHSQLSADESVLTGESMPSIKNNLEISESSPLAEKTNIIHAGTAISTGSGLAIVISTGMETELGKISGLLENTSRTETPLQVKMNQVTYKLLIIATFIIVFVIVIGISKGDAILSIIIYAISLAVAAVPESLATVVTLALAFAVRRMTKRNVIIRKLSAVETLGSADIICTDKTGTLTTGKMVVRELFTLSTNVSELALKDSEKFYRCLVLCNNASLDHGGSGDTTEIALLSIAEKHGKDLSKINSSAKRLKELSFDSDRKRMSVLVKEDESNVIYCKGAPEAILPLCNINDKEMDKIQLSINELSSKGRRILAFAFKNSDPNEIDLEKNLNFLGLTSLADPPKDGIENSIKKCKSAGIRIIMITGDHPITAKAIATELGITDSGKNNEVMTGEELDKLNSEEFKNKSEIASVYARVTSKHKLKIIEALQSNGHIVGMTGDGVNDAPALKKASIGISMGKGGTEVARQASDMILTDDNFSTIICKSHNLI